MLCALGQKKLTTKTRRTRSFHEEIGKMFFFVNPFVALAPSWLNLSCRIAAQAVDWRGKQTSQ
jgi:hypothetical protein